MYRITLIDDYGTKTMLLIEAESKDEAISRAYDRLLKGENIAAVEEVI